MQPEGATHWRLLLEKQFKAKVANTKKLSFRADMTGGMTILFIVV